MNFVFFSIYFWNYSSTLYSKCILFSCPLYDIHFFDMFMDYIALRLMFWEEKGEKKKEEI